MRVHITRRSYIVGSVSSLLALGTERMLGDLITTPAFPGYPFKLGIASGDPDSESFVLIRSKAAAWAETRLGYSGR